MSTPIQAHKRPSKAPEEKTGSSQAQTCKISRPSGKTSQATQAAKNEQSSSPAAVTSVSTSINKTQAPITRSLSGISSMKSLQSSTRPRSLCAKSPLSSPPSNLTNKNMVARRGNCQGSRKNLRSGSSVNNTYAFTNVNRTINIGKNCNVQIGNGNVMHVTQACHDDSSSTSSSSSSDSDSK